MIKEQGVGGQLLLLLNPGKWDNSQTLEFFSLPVFSQQKSTELHFTIWRGGETFLNLDPQTPAKEEWEEERLSCHSTDLYTTS